MLNSIVQFQNALAKPDYFLGLFKSNTTKFFDSNLTFQFKNVNFLSCSIKKKSEFTYLKNTLKIIIYFKSSKEWITSKTQNVKTKKFKV